MCASAHTHPIFCCVLSETPLPQLPPSDRVGCRPSLQAVPPIVGAVAVEGHEWRIAADSGKCVTVYKLKHVGGEQVAFVRWLALDKWVGNLKRSSKEAGLRLPQSVRLPAKRRLTWSIMDDARLMRRAGEIQSMLAALTGWASQHAPSSAEAAFVSAQVGQLFDERMSTVRGVGGRGP